MTPPRLERGTYRLEICCSIQLSYGALLAQSNSRSGIQRIHSLWAKRANANKFKLSNIWNGVEKRKIPPPSSPHFLFPEPGIKPLRVASQSMQQRPETRTMVLDLRVGEFMHDDEIDQVIRQSHELDVQIDVV